MSRLVRGALVLLLVVVAGCSDDDGGTRREAQRRQAAVYAAVILDIADDLPLDDDEDPADRVVYVEALDAAPIPIEVQAAVVADLEDRVDVAFVDDRDAAIDADEDGAPVREGAALVALGPVPAEGDRVEIEARRYHREDRQERLRFVVQRIGGAWEVVERTSA